MLFITALTYVIFYYAKVVFSEIFCFITVFCCYKVGNVKFAFITGAFIFIVKVFSTEIPFESIALT